MSKNKPRQASSSKRGKNKENADVESLYQLFHKTFEGDPRKQKVKANRGVDASKYKVVGTHGEDKVGAMCMHHVDHPLTKGGVSKIQLNTRKTFTELLLLLGTFMDHVVKKKMKVKRPPGVIS